jgi:hypothetical protein
VATLFSFPPPFCNLVFGDPVGAEGERGGTWAATTIVGNRARGTGILNNELYIGRLVYNRQRFVKDPDTGRRQARLNPRTDWTVVEPTPQPQKVGLVVEGRMAGLLNLGEDAKAEQRRVVMVAGAGCRQRPTTSWVFAA